MAPLRERCRIVTEQTEGTFIIVCLNLQLSFISSAVWGRNLTMARCLNALHCQMTYNGDDGCACMFVECIQRRRVGPAQKARTFVIVGVSILRCDSRLTPFEVATHLDVMRKYTTIAMVAVR